MARPRTTLFPPAVAAACAVLALATPAQAQGTGAYQRDPCADLGSYAIVDAPPPPRGAPIVAGSGNPCADLPGRPQPQVFIDAQVQIGGASPTPGADPGFGQPGPGLVPPVAVPQPLWRKPGETFPRRR